MMQETTVRICRRAFALAIATCAIGCAAHSRELGELQRFVAAERFAPRGDGVLPAPSPLPPHLFRFADTHYDTSVRLRALAAKYALALDRVMLTVNDISVGFSEDDFVSILWRHEEPKNWRLREHCAMSHLLDHIAANLNWFGGGCELKAAMRENEGARAALMSQYQADE